MKKSSTVFQHHCLYYILDIKVDGSLDFCYRHANLAHGYLKDMKPELLLIHYKEPSETEIKNDEKLLLQAFRNKYGSLPPFNSTGASFMDVADCDLEHTAYEEKLRPANEFLNYVQEKIQAFR